MTVMQAQSSKACTVIPDLGPLNWVKGEIDQALARAAESLAGAIGADDVASRLRFAQTHVHQACGALSIVGLDGLHCVAGSLDQLLGDMGREERAVDEQGIDVARRALAVIANYLEELVGGTPDQPLRLYTLYTELAAARGRPRPSPADLFFPDLAHRPQRRRTSAPPLTGDAWQQRLRALRAQFQRGLLQWLRQPAEAAGPTAMREAAEGLEALQARPEPALLWWTAQAFLDALVHGDLPADPQLRQVCAMLDKELKQLSEHQHAAPERLMRELLYWISQAPARTEQQRTAHDNWQLTSLLPADGETVSELPLGPLLSQLSNELAHAKDCWDAFCEGEAAALPRFDEHLAALRKLSPALKRPALEHLLEDISTVIQWLRTDPLQIGQAAALEIATALLLADLALERGAPGHSFDQQVAHTLTRLELLQRGEDLPPPIYSPKLEAARRAHENAARVQVTREMLANLAQIEQALDDFFRNQAKRAPLAALATPLKQIEGALAIVGDTSAIALVRQAAQAVARLAAAETADPDEFEPLAQQLSALGFYLHALEHGPADVERFLASARGTSAGETTAEPQATDLVETQSPPPDTPATASDAADTAASPAPCDTSGGAGQSAVDTLAPTAPDGAPHAGDDGAEQPATPPAPAAAAPAAADAGANAPPPDASAPEAEDAAADQELLEIFIEEAHDVLATIAAELPQLPGGEAGSPALTAIRRSFHTLKGSGRMVGLSALGEVAWSVEQTLNRWLQLDWKPSPALQAMLESAHHEFGEWVRQIEGGGSLGRDATALVAAAEALREPGTTDSIDRTATEATATAVTGTEATDAEETTATETTAAETTAAETTAAETTATDTSGDATIGATPDTPEVAAGASATPPPEAPSEDIHTDDVEISGEALDTFLDNLEGRRTVTEMLDDLDGMPDEVALDDLDTLPDETSLEDIEGHEGAEDLENLEGAEDLEGLQDLESLEDIESLESLEPQEALEATDNFESIEGLEDLDALPEVALPEVAPPEVAPPEVAPPEVAPPEVAPPEVALSEEAPAEWAPREDLDRPGPAAAAPIETTAEAAGDAHLPQPRADAAAAQAKAATTPETSPEHADHAHAEPVPTEPVPTEPVPTEPVPTEPVPTEHALAEPAPAGPVSSEPAPAETLSPAEPSSTAPEPAAVATPTAADAAATAPEREVSRALLELFLNEAQEHIASLRETFGHLQRNPMFVPAPSAERTAHTLAGISGTADVQAMRALARALEHALARVGRAGAPPTAEQAAVLQQSVITMDAMLREVASGKAPMAVPELEEQLARIGQAAATAPPADAHDGAAAGSPTDTGAQASAPVNDDIDPQLLPLFLDEGSELLHALHTTLRGWQTDGDNPIHANTTARLLHTLKGSARMTGAMQLGEFVHQLENRLEAALTAGNAPVTLLDELVAGLDDVERHIQSLGSVTTAAPPVGARAPAAPTGGAQTFDGTAAEAGSVATLRVRADTVDGFVNTAGEIGIARTRIDGELRTVRRSLLDLTENVIRLRNQLREVEIQAELQMQSRMAQAESQHADFDPLEMDRYTRLQELTRMLAESVGDVTTVQQNLLRNLDGAELALAGQARLSRELQQSLMQVRMVPFDSLADRLHRVVRQSAKELGKRVNLDLRGGRTEIDRSVLERITAPLEHLLRNAVAHGIESAEVRRAAGKEAIGQITVALGQEGNEIAIELVDDGAGLDLAAIAAKARAQGLLGPDEAADDRRLTQLIFSPGFSTAGSVSALSGRGVGMDVVRSETAAVGGRVDVRSTQGRGTKFSIHLPLTLAVTQALLVQAGARVHAVPSSMITQVMELKADALEQIRTQGGTDWQGERYPYRYLPELLGERAGRPELQRFNWLLLLRAGAQTLALHVDALKGNQEIVVKHAGPQLTRIIGISGATVLGDGQIVLIVNPVALASRRPPGAAAAGDAQDGIDFPTGTHDRPPAVMVVDDSLTVRKIAGRLLEREGYRVITAKDGSDALEQLLEEVPDVILTDIEMPRMDGFDLLRNIRADARTQAVPVIMITSRLADKHRDYAMKIGANHYLGKPYDEDELLGLIERYTTAARP